MVLVCMWRQVLFGTQKYHTLLRHYCSTAHFGSFRVACDIWLDKNGSVGLRLNGVDRFAFREVHERLIVEIDRSLLFERITQLSSTAYKRSSLALTLPKRPSFVQANDHQESPWIGCSNTLISHVSWSDARHARCHRKNNAGVSNCWKANISSTGNAILFQVCCWRLYTCIDNIPIRWLQCSDYSGRITPMYRSVGQQYRFVASGNMQSFTISGLSRRLSRKFSSVSLFGRQAFKKGMSITCVLARSYVMVCDVRLLFSMKI